MSYSATLKTARYNQTNWTENPNQARQGRYSDTTRWIGALTFADIRNVDWADQDISQITLTLRFMQIGRDEQKNIGLYWHNTDNISGNSKYLYDADRFIGSFATNGKAYVNTTINTFTANDNNPAVFNGIVAWLKNQTTKTLVIYKGDDVDGTYSKNYLSINAASMDITYSPSGSGGTLNKDSVEAGAEITMTITPLESAEGILSHDVVWAFGANKSITVSLGDYDPFNMNGQNLSCTTEIPIDWLREIPTASSGTATCTVITYENGIEKGRRVYEFTVVPPQSAAPTFQALAVPKLIGDSNVTPDGYYRYITQAKLSISGESYAEGATLASYSISGGEGETGTGYELTTGYFHNAGHHYYTLSIEDTRGMRTEKPVEINVIDVKLPTISTFEVQRYSKIADGETEQYIATDYGEYVWITASGTWDIAGGYNKVNAYVEYYPAGDISNRQRIDLSAPNGKLDLANSTVFDDRNIVFDTKSAYVFELYLGDLANGAHATDSIAKGRCNVHFAGSDYGVGFGGFSNGTQENPMVESWYPGYFYEGIYGSQNYRMDVVAKTEWLDDALSEENRFMPQSPEIYRPRVSRVGPIVFLDGVAVCISAIAVNAVDVKVMTLPEWARPKTVIHQLHQGSNRRIFWLYINTDGGVYITRIRDDTGSMNSNKGNIFPLTASWIAADAFES